MKEKMRRRDKKVLHGHMHVQYLHVYYQGVAELVAALTLCDIDHLCSAHKKMITQFCISINYYIL